MSDKGTGLKTIPIASRRSKVNHLEHCGVALTPGVSFRSWMKSLPNVLASSGLSRVVDRIIRAKKLDRPVIVAIGGHVIKTGCSPYLIDLLRNNIIDHVLLNGAAAVHDVEFAIAGQTSEDVYDGIRDGFFGMAEETPDLFREALSISDVGHGKALGRALRSRPRPGPSVLLDSYMAGVPCTVHATFGADVVHMHNLDGAAFGRQMAVDFDTACRLGERLEDAVWLNIGCATLLPEIFLKVAAIARNRGFSISGLTTVDFDMIRSYRPSTRLAISDTESHAITGHHEIMIPMLHQMIMESTTAKHVN